MDKCVLICPIGDEGSPERKRADDLIKLIVSPSLSDLNYELIRVDWIQEPGNISIQAIQLILQAKLLLADLSDKNPNVFYELAIRHFSQKPVIYLIEGSQRSPFYLQNERTVRYQLQPSSQTKGAQKQLRGFVKAVTKNYSPTDPISTAIRSMDEVIYKRFLRFGEALHSDALKTLKKARFAFAEAGFDRIRGELQVWNDGETATNVQFIHNAPVKMRLFPRNTLSSTDKNSRIIIEQDRSGFPLANHMEFDISYENSENETLIEKFDLDWSQSPPVKQVPKI